MENEYKTSTLHSHVTIGNWILSLILTMIPIVNIIMLLVWSFNNRTNPIKANWAKASLILVLVWIILGVLFGSYFMHLFYNSYPVY